MNRKPHLLLSIAITVSLSQALAQGKLKPCREGDKFGYCDASGKQVIPAVFQKVGPFDEFIAPVVRESSNWWYIDQKGRFLFNTRKWADQRPPAKKNGLYKIAYFDPDFGNVVEYYNKFGVPVKILKEDSLDHDTIVYTVFDPARAVEVANLAMENQATAKKTDCTRFLHSVFSAFGIHLPLMPRDLWEAGRPVDKNEIKLGDLVYFGGEQDKDKSIPHHIGMVVSVEEKGFRFIHACTYKGIVVNQSKEQYFAKRFLFARRISG